MVSRSVVGGSGPLEDRVDSEDSYTLTDLSVCRLNSKGPQSSDASNYANLLLAELDFEKPSTSSCQNGSESGLPQGKNEERFDNDQDMYQYYYMVEDPREDILIRIEEELRLEEAEEIKSAAAIEMLMKEIENGAENSDEVRHLEEEKKIRDKMVKEKRREKEHLRELRRQIAMENNSLQVFCCFVCSKVFTEEEVMRQHVSEKHLAFKKEYSHKCSKCYRRFHTWEEISLKIHMSKVHQLSIDGKRISKNYRCECGKTFGLQEELKRHRYYCGAKDKIAEKRRKARQELDAMSTISGAPSVSSNSDAGSTPSLLSTSGRPVKDKSCPFCFLVCASMQSRRRHIERKHPEALAEVSLPYVCEMCYKTFATHASLSTHKKRVHENKNIYECSACSRRYPLASELRKHIRRVHDKFVGNGISVTGRRSAIGIGCARVTISKQLVLVHSAPVWFVQQSTMSGELLVILENRNARTTLQNRRRAAAALKRAVSRGSRSLDEDRVRSERVW
ncbi:zinc finger, C2H2 type [Dictyocaulus viviparus]|uniref:Zinc finger, C2H2 type n=1 Tax=Dictyocaulus viviparus TaxID=29172 RepID=A0A0D8Y9P0_DICVI|nr:zinc finger, C2H2 type [Dictyocaulus viviparus]